MVMGNLAFRVCFKLTGKMGPPPRPANRAGVRRNVSEFKTVSAPRRPQQRIEHEVQFFRIFDPARARDGHGPPAKPGGPPIAVLFRRQKRRIVCIAALLEAAQDREVELVKDGTGHGV
ncbi:MAG: hypothetical protein ACFB0F_12830, partial [Neomegalonema sp.]